MGRAIDRPLRHEWIVFIEQYIRTNDRVESYRAAYPGTTSSAKGAYRCATTLLDRKEIKEELRAQRAETRRAMRITTQNVLDEVASIAFCDPLDIVDQATGTLRPLACIPIRTRKAIQSIKVSKVKTTTRQDGNKTVEETESVVEVKFWNKLDALQKLCTHLGITAEPEGLDAIMSFLPQSVRDELRACLEESQRKESIAHNSSRDFRANTQAYHEKRSEESAARKLLAIPDPFVYEPRKPGGIVPHSEN